MFEQLIRPFESRQVTNTRRIVPVVTDAVAETAILSWGKVGTVALGVQQPDGVDLLSGDFRLNRCHENWHQKGKPETEEYEVPLKNANGTDIGKAIAERIKKINFSKRNTDERQPFSYAAVGVRQVIAGLHRDIPGSDSCDHSYSLKY